MKVILSEDHVRIVVAEALKIASTKTSGLSSSSSMTHPEINFEYEEIVDEMPAQRAEAEMKKWAGKKENSPDVKSTLIDYWKATGGNYAKNPESAISAGEPWSAAFISYVKEDPFFKSSAHNTWKQKASENTKNINDDPTKFAGKEMYVALPINDKNGERIVKLNPGDNVWKPRSGGPGKSHSDIVVSSDRVIGGNLSDTVGKRSIDHELVIKKVIVGEPKSKSSKNKGLAQKQSATSKDNKGTVPAAPSDEKGFVDKAVDTVKSFFSE
jgi:hypothetical protein